MRRFISYIYHYAEGTYKCGNVGFCKVEQDGDWRTVTLCVKDVKPMEGSCKVYNLREGGRGSGTAPVYTRYRVDKTLTMCQGKLSEKLRLEGGDGLLLQCGDRQYVALWRSCQETISIVDGDSETEKKAGTERKRDENVKKQEESKDREVVRDRANNNMVAPKREASEYDRLYNRMGKSRMILDDIEYQVVKLKPQDMMWFPRCHWRLINNCFVMDGYYRYGHILFLKYNGDYIIAVPALETAKTPEVATKFGFPHSMYGSEYGREDVKRPYWYKIL